MRELLLLGLVILVVKAPRRSALADPEDPNQPDDSSSGAGGTWTGSSIEPHIPQEFNPLLIDPDHHAHGDDIFDRDPGTVFGFDQPGTVGYGQMTTDQFHAAGRAYKLIIGSIPAAIRQKIANVKGLTGFHRRLIKKIF